MNENQQTQPTVNSEQNTDFNRSQPTPTKSNNFLVTLLSILLLLAVAAAGFFAYQTQNLVKQLSEYKSVSSPTPTTNNLQPTSSPDPTADWEIYTNAEYNFQVKHPSNFEALTSEDDLYGWPNAIVLFYNGGQSYDLPIEVWNSKQEYETRYTNLEDTVVRGTDNGKFITLSNINKEDIVNQIISTFEFIEN